MKNETLDIVLKVVARAVGVYGVKLTQDEFDATFSASAELDRMRRPSILNDPVTITEDELKALGWKRIEDTFRPRCVYFCPYATDLQVELINGEPIVQIKASHDGWVFPDGVKTIDDLTALARYLTGRSA